MSNLRRSPVDCVLAGDRTRHSRNAVVYAAIKHDIREAGADIVCDRDDWRALRRRSERTGA